ncbi:bifunctional acetate--CoA ligase family protein/GNAT family N-acetyltransferase [Salinivibrio proteolyticus]|uniref:Bifunctional acetate--CoA ligase family protein/GNAT family N-acetyltransferase n=1 Tax=Salinivibrio proteolyticus TaxID=334715 RepID=A0ABY7LI84_9GAMM|nr:bifunctional acetate--CoA ligase family protein/GNAT family N-acetyltransferase [Salinivibrio proteolyticus]WBA16244.1 bifunctional acetate--CoA ligase family protein/GNAT family N-acetyltransferase [Salinivibrio proteolyticus]
MSGIDQLLKPKSIAVVGASDRANRAGYVVTRNLQSGGFQGPIMPVTPKYQAVAGILAYKTIEALPLVPDLAILCTRGEYNLSLIEQLGERGVKLVIVLAAGMRGQFNEQGESHFSRMQAIAARYTMRVLGPNSLGMILPWLNLNASFAPVSANKGNIAFISQSAAVCTTILDWAKNKRIGFSTFISLGEACDIDFPELLDYLCRDSKTDAILLYVDSIRDARRFISAARAAARNRRILVLKSGRTRGGSVALEQLSHTNMGLDAAYDAAIRRSGMLRVNNTHELFAAVETLSHSVPLRGERLAIITNGGGPAVMAVDTLMDSGGKLASLSEKTIEALNQVLPASWSRTNPIDIVGDADTQRYQDAIDILLTSDDADALLIMHSPSVTAPGLATAKAIIAALKENPRARRFNILTNWQGEGDDATVARLAFTHAGYPTYRTPESAVTAYMHLVEYRRNQKQLMETPTSTGQTDYDLPAVRAFIDQAEDIKHLTLTTHEVRPLLEAYGLHVMSTWLASDPVEAAQIAEQVGYPVAVKLRSPDIQHKSDVQGVMLNLRTAAEVANASQAILDRVSMTYPNARIQGLLIQSMAPRAGAQELRVTITNDPVFGTIILLGEGGSDWDVTKDAAVAIPPLNMALARYLVIGAIKSGKIKQRGFPVSIDVPSLCRFLVTLSQMIIDCPEIDELDIHPLLVAGDELTVLDASLQLRDYAGSQHQRLAIRPYPKELEQQVTLKNGDTLLLRPILPEDEPTHKAFVEQVSEEDLYRRFFSDVGELNHEALANLTQIDYDREMALVATYTSPSGQEEIWGVVRLLADPENTEAEFAVLVRSDLKGVGLGSILMTAIIDYAKQAGLSRITGMTMPANRGMIGLAQKCGFSIDVQMADGVVDMLLPLHKNQDA